MSFLIITRDHFFCFDSVPTFLSSLLKCELHMDGALFCLLLTLYCQCLTETLSHSRGTQHIPSWAGVKCLWKEWTTISLYIPQGQAPCIFGECFQYPAHHLACRKPLFILAGRNKPCYVPGLCWESRPGTGVRLTATFSWDFDNLMRWKQYMLIMKMYKSSWDQIGAKPGFMEDVTFDMNL